jgi:hypothetical protein
VLDFPKMIAKLESMNIRQENPKKDLETKATRRTLERIRESIVANK